MSKPMFHRSNPKWQIGVAFCGAVLVHVGAVALAQRPETVAVPLVIGPVAIEVIPIVEEATPPQDPAPPPLPTSESAFVDETPTPPPVRQRVDRPLQRPVPTTVVQPRLGMGSARVLAISAPRPEYPYEARRQRATGSGVAALMIDPATGYVVDVRMVRSTGNAVLDNATISGFRRWRFKPGTVSAVQTPVTYTLTGFGY